MLPGGIAILLEDLIGILLIFVALVFFITAVTSGGRAKTQGRSSGGRWGGERVASAGQIMGWVGIGLCALGLCMICGLAGLFVLSEDLAWIVPGLLGVVS